MPDCFQSGAVDDVHVVGVGVPVWGEAGAFIDARVDDVDGRNAGIIDINMIIGHPAAVLMKEKINVP